MNPNDLDHRHAKLEADVHRLARSLPLRPASASLEARVLAAVAAQRAPRGVRSFESWSPFMRGAFLVAALGFAVASVWLLLPVPFGEVWTVLGDALTRVGSRITALGDAVQTLGRLLFGALPEWVRVWGQLALLTFGAIYVATLAAGAAAWRWWQADGSTR
jgi:hypothetical protein